MICIFTGLPSQEALNGRGRPKPFFQMNEGRPALRSALAHLVNHVIGLHRGHFADLHGLSPPSMSRAGASRQEVAHNAKKSQSIFLFQFDLNILGERTPYART
jgi:hypothetical protein